MSCTPTLLKDYGSQAAVGAQVYDLPAGMSTTLCDVVFTFKFTSGTTCTFPKPLLAGPFSATLSYWTGQNTADAASWTAMVAALAAAPPPRVVTDIGFPSKPLHDVSFANNQIEFPSIPAPLATSSVVGLWAVNQHVYVVFRDVEKAPMAAYFDSSVFVNQPNILAGILSFGLTFSSIGGDPIGGPIMSNMFLMGATPGAMPLLSDNNVQDTVTCPDFAPFYRGICDLNGPNAPSTSNLDDATDDADEDKRANYATILSLCLFLVLVAVLIGASFYSGRRTALSIPKTSLATPSVAAPTFLQSNAPNVLNASNAVPMFDAALRV